MIKNVKNQVKGITLIALVVTIIVLLILAGVAINLSIGNNGLFNRAESAKEITSKSQLEEEIKFKVMEAQLDKGGENLSREDVLDAVLRLEGVTADIDTDIIQGEYNDYFFEIDENNNVIVGDKLTGEKPTGKAEIITEEKEVEEVEIRVTASIEEGRIMSIEARTEAELVESEDNTDTVKIFKTKVGGTHRFRIKAENGRSTTVSCEVNNIVAFSIEDDMITAVEKINRGGRRNIQVTGKKSDGTETTELYSMNVIYHKGDMTLDGISTYDGSTLISESKTYEFGNAESDVATGREDSQMARNTVVLKVEGNLTINEDVILTAVKSTEGYGGPKGMVVYCTGTLTNNGVIDMTARGAYAEGQDVYLFKNIDGTYEYVPATGGAGGTVRAGSWGTSRNVRY